MREDERLRELFSRDAEIPGTVEARMQRSFDELRERAGEKGKTMKYRNGRNLARTLLLAAILTALLSVTAYAVWQGRIAIREDRQADNYGSAVVEVGFEQTDEEPVHLGVWTLEAVPAGYEPKLSWYHSDDAYVKWFNAEGESFAFEYQKADRSDKLIAEEGLRERRDVSVGGEPGVLYLSAVADHAMLVWVNSERGIGFTLIAPEDWDLIAMAESVRELEGKPPLSTVAQEAMADLGDWAPALPAGYEEWLTDGCPKSWGGEGGYAYVYRTYTGAEGGEIHLDYEAAYGELEDYVSYYRDTEAGLGEITFTPLTVGGFDGWLMEYEDGSPFRITWMDTERMLIFHLYADSLSSEELTALALSVEQR